MEYKNSEIKIDALVSYLNEDKINLSPAFQRGHVWTLGTRQKLLKNIVLAKPIPSVFLYKEAAGTKYSYNILDGKQRIESIILFIGRNRTDFKIENWERYFSEAGHRAHGNFKIEVDNNKTSFADLPENYLRDFREYAIPAIEISLDDDTSLDEIISLFVDINQQGEAVKRFDIVKALCKEDSALRSTFGLIAREKRKGQDVAYKMVNNEITYVLKRLQIVSSGDDNKAKVDRMWERLLELAIFEITRQHRKPVEILKGFISKKTKNQYKLKKSNVTNLRRVFSFLKAAFQKVEIVQSPFATDQTHFYTLATALLSTDLLTRNSENILIEKLVHFAKAVRLEKSPTPELSKMFKEYLTLSQKQTTDTSKRQRREVLFKDMLGRIGRGNI